MLETLDQVSGAVFLTCKQPSILLSKTLNYLPTIIQEQREAQAFCMLTTSFLPWNEARVVWRTWVPYTCKRLYEGPVCFTLLSHRGMEYPKIVWTLAFTQDFRHGR